MTINYLILVPLFKDKEPEEWLDIFDAKIVPDWITAYLQSTSVKANIVGVNVDGSDYVFDINSGRGIGTFSISGGKHTGPRPKSRMRRHPQSAGSNYHRGHMIAHTLGGGTDINLVSQRGRLNIGSFRKLENQAVKKIGALYFVRLIYDASNDGQLPDRIEQGLISNPQQPNVQVRLFQN